MTKKTKTRDPYRMTTGQMLAWNGRGVSIAANVTILTYLTYYCTNMLGIPAGLAGTLLLVSKVFDGFTDLIAGFIIEKTHTRFGKARPYEFSIIAVWLCTILLFACPDFGMTGKCIVTAKREPSIKRQGKQAYAAIDLFGYMQLQISAEEVFNNIHELRRIKPANGAAESETHNGPAICGDIRDKENRFCA